MRQFKQVFSIAARVFISVVLLFLLFKFNNITFADVLVVIRNADKRYLTAAFFLFSGTFAAGLYRWCMLLDAAGIHLSRRRVFVSFAGGTFFSLFLPSTIGGDLTRSIDLGAHTNKPRQIVATVFIDRLSGFIGLVFVALCALALGWRHVSGFPAVYFSIAVISVILLAVLFVFFNTAMYARISRFLRVPNAGRWRDILKDVHEEIHIFRGRKSVILANIGCSIAIQVIVPISVFLVARALGSDLGIHYFLLFLPVIGAVSLLPISIGGLGLRENMTVFLFAHAGMEQHMALSMSLLNFFFLVIYSAIGGLIYVLGVRYRRLQSPQASVVQSDAA